MATLFSLAEIMKAEPRSQKRSALIMRSTSWVVLQSTPPKLSWLIWTLAVLLAAFAGNCVGSAQETVPCTTVEETAPVQGEGAPGPCTDGATQAQGTPEANQWPGFAPVQNGAPQRSGENAVRTEPLTQDNRAPAAQDAGAPVANSRLNPGFPEANDDASWGCPPPLPYTNVPPPASADLPAPTAPSRGANLRRSGNAEKAAHAPGDASVPQGASDASQDCQRMVPYANIPSLMSLYVQVPTGGAKLQRFGSGTFAYGTGNANELPADIPVGPDFVLGQGDSIIVNMWGSQTNRLPQVIDRQGEIALPEVGTITLAGMTIAQAQNAIQALLNTQFRSEHVEISLGRVHTVRIYVVGEVQRPGAYDVSALSSPLSALYAAGGPTSRGSLRVLRQFRAKNLVREVDLYDLLLKGVRPESERLLPGDVLVVPPAVFEVTVDGMVHHPAIYELNGEQTLQQVLDLAGGVLPTASLKEIKVQRVVAHERRIMLDLQLSGEAGQLQRQLADFKVQPGDDVVVAQILPYSENTVFLQGHVYRPGMFPYREGMTASDLLHSYQDVLPEPSDHAELVRLVPPDYHPETTPFDLHGLLVGNLSLPLQPFDLIRVFGRYQIDAPLVSINGEVMRPGRYPMSNGMTVSALIKMAGGYTRRAYRSQVDLVSYEVENGQRVVVNHREVAAESALDGDANADVVLKPGDVVSIRQLEGLQNIGATIKVSGEVEHPGTYAIIPGERLSAVLKRAGGFTADAYPPATVFERPQVRELSEQARQQMIQRIENTPVEFRAGTMTQEAAEAMQQALQKQKEQALEALRKTPASGRMVIHISADIGKWQNTSADIELRAGDSLAIPKRPDFVVVSGQVFNPGAISYVPGRDLNWYLREMGGPTRLGDKRSIYVLHADGSLTPKTSNWDSSFRQMRMRPGDEIFVPEKVMGGSPIWQNVIGIAQVMAAAALPLSIAGTL